MSLKKNKSNDKFKSNDSIKSSVSKSTFGSAESLCSIESYSSIESVSKKNLIDKDNEVKKNKLFIKQSSKNIFRRRRKKDEYSKENLGKSPTIEDALRHIRRNSEDWGYFIDDEIINKK